jgi:UDP-N-acetylmuramoyl-tripeptide--D-alanyl-D-alanine ligase
MFKKIKHLLYFPIASYFRFFAAIRLRMWNPKVVVITGSSGKTTLLHLVESQLGDLAKYSHEANSSFGIPFDILGIRRTKLTLDEWPKIFLIPLINVFKAPPTENIYVVEADCDRPNEGKFLSHLLKPDITLWINVARTHSMNFQKLVGDGKFKTVEEAIASEFGNFARSTKSLVIVNGDSKPILDQIDQITCNIKTITMKKNLKKYTVTLSGTKFQTNMGDFDFPYLLPKEIFTSVLMSLNLVNQLGFSRDAKFSKFRLPPGRNSFFKGIKDTTLVDSSYNANLDSMEAIINMFNQIESKTKWVVLGDMLEQGKFEKEEHEKLASLIAKGRYNKIVLMGPRVTKYTLPKLINLMPKEVKIEHFMGPKEVLNYLTNSILGDEVILFKGARFLEGVIENLLANKADADKLSRREKVWEIRRNKWGL